MICSDMQTIVRLVDCIRQPFKGFIDFHFSVEQIDDEKAQASLDDYIHTLCGTSRTFSREEQICQLSKLKNYLISLGNTWGQEIINNTAMFAHIIQNAPLTDTTQGKLIMASIDRLVFADRPATHIVCDLKDSNMDLFLYEHIVAFLPIWAVRAGCNINWMIETEYHQHSQVDYSRTVGWQIKGDNDTFLICQHANKSRVTLTDMPQLFDSTPVDQLSPMTVRLLLPNPGHRQIFKDMVFSEQSKHSAVLSVWVRCPTIRQSFPGGFQSGVHGYATGELKLVYDALTTSKTREESRLIE